jgi:hypothetical protein
MSLVHNLLSLEVEALEMADAPAGHEASRKRWGRS